MKERAKVIGCVVAGVIACIALGVGIFFGVGKNNAEQLMKDDITSDSVKSELAEKLQNDAQADELGTESEDAADEDGVPVFGNTLVVDGEEIDIEGKDVKFNGTEIIVDGNRINVADKEVLIDGQEIVLKTEEDIVNTKVETETEQEEQETIVYKGKEYRYKDNLFNIVCLGLDKHEGMGIRDDESNSMGQSDVMLMTSLDLDNKRISIIAIPRNTMVTLEMYSGKGKYYGQRKGQITLQYAYGDGKKLSAVLASEQVSKVLNDVPINAYATIDLSSLEVIGDAIGGVDVTMNADYTYIDPAFQKGRVVHLEGELLEKFVRYRDVTVFASAESRLERQKVLLKAFVPQGKAALAKKPTLAVSLLNSLGNHLETNVTVDTASYLATEVVKCGFSSKDLYSLPGKVVMGEKYEEFYLDDDAVMDIVIKVFYEPVE